MIRDRCRAEAHRPDRRWQYRKPRTVNGQPSTANRQPSTDQDEFRLPSVDETDGLTREEIIEAIKAGKLQYRHNNVFGNPYLKLVRSEVEAVVDEKYGDNYLKKKKIKKELAQTKRDLKKLKAQVTSLEQRKSELQASLDECE